MSPKWANLSATPDFARTLKLMCEAEEAASTGGRAAGIQAARDVFYRGAVAEAIVAYVGDNPG